MLRKGKLWPILREKVNKNNPERVDFANKDFKISYYKYVQVI